MCPTVGCPATPNDINYGYWARMKFQIFDSLGSGPKRISDMDGNAFSGGGILGKIFGCRICREIYFVGPAWFEYDDPMNDKIVRILAESDGYPTWIG